MKVTLYAQKLKNLHPWLYKLGAQAWIDYKFPRHLFIETTAACNLRCDYCPRTRINNHMDFDVFRAIIDESSRYGARSFSLHLFGEPFLYPKIFEAIHYIKEKNRKHTILLTTNGTLVERYLDRIIDSGIDKLIWSWRPETKFSKETKERLTKWGRLTVRMIKGVTPQNAFEEWGNHPGLEIRELHNYGGDISLEKFGVSSTAGKRWPCYHLWYAPAVSWNGDLLICCSDPHKKEVLGNIRDMTISDAWQKLSKIRESHLKGRFEGICKGCDVWKSYPPHHFSWQYTTSSSSENSI